MVNYLSLSKFIQSHNEQAVALADLPYPNLDCRLSLVFSHSVFFSLVGCEDIEVHLSNLKEGWHFAPAQIYSVSYFSDWILNSFDLVVYKDRGVSFRIEVLV